MRKDKASGTPSVQTGLSEVGAIGPVGPEMKTSGKGQVPTANPKGAIKGADRPGNPRWK
jgi:hypothetical protein